MMNSGEASAVPTVIEAIERQACSPRYCAGRRVNATAVHYRHRLWTGLQSICGATKGLNASAVQLGNRYALRIGAGA